MSDLMISDFDCVLIALLLLPATAEWLKAKEHVVFRRLPD